MTTTPLPESKIEATDRLRQAGLWNEASQYRDQQRDRLRAEGMKRKEAVDEAWKLMLAKYPPRMEEPVEVLDVPVDDLAAHLEGAPPDLIRDVLWTYDNLGNKQVQSAPSAGALSLLTWARGHRDRFFEQLLPKAIAAAGKERDAQIDAHLDMDDQFRMLDEFAAFHKAETEKAEIEARKQDRVLDCPACGVKVVLPRAELGNGPPGSFRQPPLELLPPEHPLHPDNLVPVRRAK